MAKRSRVDTEQTVNQILDEALKQILTIGYEAMSYTTLSNATGISRTGISHHFPKKTEFLVRLDLRISEIFIQALDFTSVETLNSSWLSSMKKSEYKSVLRLFFSLCGHNEGDVTFFRTINIVKATAFTHLGRAGNTCIDTLIGTSAMVLMAEASQEYAA